MRRGLAPEQLRQISAIRELQQTAAREKAARAAMTKRDQEERRRESERVRTEAEDCWIDAVSAPSLNLDLSRSWSAELRVRDQALVCAGHDLEQAGRELKQRTNDWHLATVRSEKAQDLFDSAKKAQRKRREEHALQEAAERMGQLAWWKSCR